MATKDGESNSDLRDYHSNLGALNALLSVPLPRPVPPRIAPILGATQLHPRSSVKVAEAADIASLHHSFLESLAKDVKMVDTAHVPALVRGVESGGNLSAALEEKARECYIAKRQTKMGTF